MTTLLAIAVVAQALIGAIVVLRLLRSRRGTHIRRSDAAATGRVAIVVPVLDERDRLDDCLDALEAQPPAVTQMLIVDGGSRDGTQALVAARARRDPRIHLVDASPVPADATGKAWGLDVGVRALAAEVDWVLFLDADVVVSPALAPSLLAHAARHGLHAFSVATRQRLSGPAEAVLHPSLLATLVYRFGGPGHATDDPSRIQANGQCFVVRRTALARARALEVARGSLCEDVTIARALAASGITVGFYEADDLATTSMYAGWREAWRSWPRSLPMRDQFFDWRNALGLAEIVVVQALPLPALVIALLCGAPLWMLGVEAGLGACRIGVLAGMRRGYVDPPWTYWLSPLADLPVALRVAASAFRRHHRWRGRSYARRGRFWIRMEEPS